MRKFLFAKEYIGFFTDPDGMILIVRYTSAVSANANDDYYLSLAIYQLFFHNNDIFVFHSNFNTTFCDPTSLFFPFQEAKFKNSRKSDAKHIRNHQSNYSHYKCLHILSYFFEEPLRHY